jgi:hypothetical protein
MAVTIDKETKEVVPFTAFVNASGWRRWLLVTDAARGKWLTVAGMVWRCAQPTRSRRRRTSS